MEDNQKDLENIQKDITALEHQLGDLRSSYNNTLAENDLLDALQRLELRVYYQPIVRLKTGDLMGFEALLRWHHPARGLVLPHAFLPLAMQSDLIYSIENYVLNEAAMQLSQWQKRRKHNREIFIAVNLTGKHFERPDLVKEIERLLTFNQIETGTLHLEITEDTLMQDFQTASASLEALKGMGVKVSIDDFGTGHSSLAYVHRLSVNCLKIDMSFVQSMKTGSQQFEIIRMIIQLAQQLGLEVIAEGIETGEQLSTLISLGCEYGQGHLFSPAVDAATAVTVLKKGSFSIRHFFGVTIIKD